MTIMIDTHKAVRNLTDAGIEAAHAEALVQTFHDINPDLATRADLRELKASNKEEIQKLRGEMQETKGEVQELRGEMQELRGEMQELRGEVQELRGDMRETKGEVQNLRGEVKTDIGELKAHVSQSETRMTRMNAGFFIALVIIMLSAVRYLPPVG